ncbi:hypothetical protein TVAG_019450 [Trichomonas vaginalis G3]|uniref:Sulfatase N-terminal domain-containing protein n=1 Tax=Trichomonas vaginalis (strain ATCC PRA-98 / G3) TaxID=412133 RepID=A2DX18_TRIV3|nr:sulfatase family [Trichomonas vaginalis G3]EAY15045.1 hypothetical protein TVAG_019450 [Trichomonas vaginalis G3]KAI5549586.1 sulfatase family [Trichomonas vaginalis G3]|eukprot:XP_001327268.1 hypothetical protein [Trichomonas vaginalis G3]
MNFAMIQFYSLGISICKYIFRVYGVITMNNIAIAFDKGSLNAKLNLLQYKSIIYNFITSTGIQCFIITSLLCYLIYKYFPLKVIFFELKPFFSFTLKTHHIKFIYLLTFISMLITIYKPTEVSESDFMQLNYVNPKDLVTFPGEKRNIIYLFLESMESTFASKQSGGLFEQSLIPNLEKLAKDKENIHFTHKEGFFGGPKQMERMSYTAGASYSMICGNYIGTPGFMTTEENEKIFHPQLTCLPDITKKFGYNNIAIYGTQWSSCKQGYVFTSHSIPYQNIIDSYAINKTDVWVRDFLMFEKAKKKIWNCRKKKNHSWQL